MTNTPYPAIIVGLIAGFLASGLPVSIALQILVGFVIIAAFIFGKHVAGGYGD